jgi:hypothetical protein
MISVLTTASEKNLEMQQRTLPFLEKADVASD